MKVFIFKCPQCGSNVEADATLRGQVAECPYCEKGIVIPQAGGWLSPRGEENSEGNQATIDQQEQRPVLRLQQRPKEPVGAVPRAQTHYEIMLETEARRRFKEKILGATVFIIKASVAFLFVCLVCWITNSTWGKMKKAEQQKEWNGREAELERTIKSMEDKVASITKSLEGANNAVAEERQRVETVKTEHQRETDELLRQHKEEITKLNEEHAREIDELKALFERRIIERRRNALAAEKAEEPVRPQPNLVQCNRCYGKGEIQRKVTCTHCGGSGRIKETTKRWVGGDYFRSGREKVNTTFSDCPYCLPGAMRGSGSKGYTIQTETCPKCGGRGKISSELAN